MTIQILPDQIYRIILDYEALQDAFADRIEDLNVPLTEVDAAGELTRGNAQKLLCKTDAKWARQFGWESLGKMLKGTGMALVMIVDDERFAPIREQMTKRERPIRKPANAGSVRPTWLFRKKKAREMGKRRFALMSDSERKRHQRKAGKASAAARRRKRLERERAANA